MRAVAFTLFGFWSFHLELGVESALGLWLDRSLMGSFFPLGSLATAREGFSCTVHQCRGNWRLPHMGEEGKHPNIVCLLLMGHDPRCQKPNIEVGGIPGRAHWNNCVNALKFSA